MSEKVDQVKKAVGEVLTRDRRGMCLLIASDEELEEIARAAIAAMREPTETMRAAVEADRDIQNGLDDCNKHDIPYDAWRLMIDAALKD